jgi:hypothetical protein
MLGGPSAAPAARALAELLQARRFGQAAETLMGWEGSRLACPPGAPPALLKPPPKPAI